MRFKRLFYIGGILVILTILSSLLAGGSWGQVPLTINHSTLSMSCGGSQNFSASGGISLLVGRCIYAYDELNRLIQVIYEDGRKVTYTYDASGNRITVTNE